MVDKKHAVLAGGGSAGHVNPLLSVATELRQRGYQITVLGTAEGLESELVPASGFKLVIIPKVPMPRLPSKSWFTLHRRLNEAIKIAGSEVKGADVVVGFGGYVSTPAYLAAKQMKVPLVIHEQNVKPGLANRLGSRFSAAVGLTFSSTHLVSKRGITEVTGLPLRDSIASLAKDRADKTKRQERRIQAAKEFGLDPELPTLLVTGGSLGAQHLNESVVEAAKYFPSGVQVLHLTGKNKDQQVREGLNAAFYANNSGLDEVDNLGNRWIVLDYLQEMERALAVADLVLCRSGAGTVAEMSALGLPAIYVPLPIGNGEQRLNAAEVVENGGAFLVNDADFSSQTVADLVIPTLLNQDRLQQMAEAALEVGQKDATANITNLIEKALR